MTNYVKKGFFQRRKDVKVARKVYQSAKSKSTPPAVEDYMKLDAGQQAEFRRALGEDVKTVHRQTGSRDNALRVMQLAGSVDYSGLELSNILTQEQHEVLAKVIEKEVPSVADGTAGHEEFLKAFEVAARIKLPGLTPQQRQEIGQNMILFKILASMEEPNLQLTSQNLSQILTPAGKVGFAGLSKSERTEIDKNLQAVAASERKYVELFKLLDLASAVCNATEWEIGVTDYNIVNPLLEVLESFEMTDPGGILAARKAVESLWNGNYYYGDFWEEMLLHEDPNISVFVIEKAADVKGGDVLFEKGINALVKNMYMSPAARKYIVDNFDKLEEKPTMDVILNFRSKGITPDMVSLIPKLAEYEETTPPLLAWMMEDIRLVVSVEQVKVNGNKIDQKELEKAKAKAVAKAKKTVRPEIEKALKRLEDYVEDSEGEEKMMLAAVFKVYGVEKEVPLGEKEIPLLKKTAMNNNEMFKLRLVTARLLVGNKTPQAEKLEKEAVDRGVEIFDTSYTEPVNIEQQIKGYVAVKVFVLAGSKHAKKAMEGIKEDIVEDLAGLQGEGADVKRKELLQKMLAEAEELLK